MNLNQMGFQNPNNINKLGQTWLQYPSFIHNTTQVNDKFYKKQRKEERSYQGALKIFNGCLLSKLLFSSSSP